MIQTVITLLWIFGSAMILYGGSIWYAAWHSPEDSEAGKWYVVAGMAAFCLAMEIQKNVQ